MLMASGSQQFDGSTKFIVYDRELLKKNFCQIRISSAAVQILADGLLLCEGGILRLK